MTLELLSGSEGALNPYRWTGVRVQTLAVVEVARWFYERCPASFGRGSGGCERVCRVPAASVAREIPITP